MTKARTKRHLFFHVRGALWLFQSIQVSVKFEQSAACSLRQLDADLLQSRHHTIGAQVRIAGQAADFLNILKRNLTRWLVWSMRFIFEAGVSLHGPPFQDIQEVRFTCW